MPDEYQLTDSLDKLPIGNLDDNTLWTKIMEMLIWFFGPLALFIIIDIIWLNVRRKKKFIPAREKKNEKKI